jgi:hypothetical protein
MATNPAKGNSYCGVFERYLVLVKEVNGLSKEQQQRAFHYRLRVVRVSVKKLAELSVGKEKEAWQDAAKKYQVMLDLYESSGRQLTNTDAIATFAEAVGASDKAFRSVKKRVAAECKLDISPLLLKKPK